MQCQTPGWGYSWIMPTPYITKTFYCSTIHSYLNNFTLITKITTLQNPEVTSSVNIPNWKLVPCIVDITDNVDAAPTAASPMWYDETTAGESETTGQAADTTCVTSLRPFAFIHTSVADIFGITHAGWLFDKPTPICSDSAGACVPPGFSVHFSCRHVNWNFNAVALQRSAASSSDFFNKSFSF